MRVFKIPSRRTFLSVLFQLDGLRRNFEVTRPVVSRKRESSNVSSSRSVGPVSVFTACLAKPSSTTGFKNPLITSMYGSDLSLKNSSRSHGAPIYNLSDMIVCALMIAWKNASSRVISLADA